MATARWPSSYFEINDKADLIDLPAGAKQDRRGMSWSVVSTHDEQGEEKRRKMRSRRYNPNGYAMNNNSSQPERSTTG